MLKQTFPAAGIAAIVTCAAPAAGGIIIISGLVPGSVVAISWSDKDGNIKGAVAEDTDNDGVVTFVIPLDDQLNSKFPGITVCGMQEGSKKESYWQQKVSEGGVNHRQLEPLKSGKYKAHSSLESGKTRKAEEPSIYAWIDAINFDPEQVNQRPGDRFEVKDGISEDLEGIKFFAVQREAEDPLEFVMALTAGEIELPLYNGVVEFLGYDELNRAPRLRGSFETTRLGARAQPFEERPWTILDREGLIGRPGEVLLISPMHFDLEEQSKPEDRSGAFSPGEFFEASWPVIGQAQVRDQSGKELAELFLNGVLRTSGNADYFINGLAEYTAETLEPTSATATFVLADGDRINAAAMIEAQLFGNLSTNASFVPLRRPSELYGTFEDVQDKPEMRIQFGPLFGSPNLLAEVRGEWFAFYTPPPCPADFDADDDRDIQDLLAYLSAFRMRDASADIDENGQINIQDLLAYLSIFRKGCPQQ